MLKIGRQGWQFLSIIHLKLKIHQTVMEFQQIPKSDFKKPLLNDKIPSQEPFAGYSINAPKTTILFFLSKSNLYLLLSVFCGRRSISLIVLDYFLVCCFSAFCLRKMFESPKIKKKNWRRKKCWKKKLEIAKSKENQKKWVFCFRFQLFGLSKTHKTQNSKRSRKNNERYNLWEIHGFTDSWVFKCISFVFFLFY